MTIDLSKDLEKIVHDAVSRLLCPGGRRDPRCPDPARPVVAQAAKRPSRKPSVPSRRSRSPGRSSISTCWNVAC